MNKVISLMIITLIVSFSLPAQDKAGETIDLEVEKAAIKQATLDYINGWFGGEPERIDRALHPDLAKRGVMTERKTGRTILSFASKATMIEYTRAGYGKTVARDLKDVYVKILDIFQNVACVRVTSPFFMDYLHLAKCNGKWQIVNILWVPLQFLEPKEAPPKNKKDK
jgi:hypothetical protein